MARATRSAAAAATTTTTTTTVKRKRQETTDKDEPPQKQSRRDEDGRIPTQQALSILDILEMIDCQGLLDRVFPVQNSSSTSSSLRTLLNQPDPFLNVLHTAVQHLFPISSLPRANPSSTATQQLRFCNLAHSLLGQASRHSGFDLSLETILPDSTEPSSPKRPLKYALVQRLPNQDYWTSLNSDTALANALKTLPTAQAELVAILPTPTLTQSKQPVPTLGTYASARPSSSIKPLPTHRTVTTGAFLDYGPYASFAPPFDHNAQVVGRRELGLALYASNEKRRHRLMIQEKEKDYQESREKVSTQHLTPTDGSQNEAYEGKFPTSSTNVDLDIELQEFLSPEDIESFKASILTLELENAVHELLDRNRRAILRLEELQTERLTSEGDNSKVVEGSEEWDTAQGIVDTLTVFASLRPRTSSDKLPPSIVPPPSLLHKLHRTLALEPSSGWHGTLPGSTPTTRPIALRDDTTVKKSRSAPTLPATATSTNNTPAPAATPAAAVPVTMTPPVAIPYSGYTYAYGTQQQQPYRIPNSSTTATANGATAASTQYAQYAPQYYAQQTYYGAQQQGYAAYQGWYNAYSSLQQQQGAQQGQAGSGRSTPQPQAPAATYGSFFGNTGVGVKAPVVANTVYAPQGQATATALPAHLRSVAAQGTQAAQQGYYQQPLPTTSSTSGAGK